MNISKLRNFASCVAVALLAGCGAAPPITQQVDIPVFTSCVKEAIPKPDFEFDKLPLDAPDGEKVLALARDWPRGRIYEGKLEAAIAGCL
jgi:hypothetical protein